MSAHYDDPNYLYTDYWEGRDYENASEIIAIKKLLQGKHFKNSIDIGGGYGRLLPTFQQFSSKLTLLEPSIKLRKIALKTFAKNTKINIISGSAQKTGQPNSSFELVSIIRVLHHLPDPKPALLEIHRILKPGGYLLLEFANSYNFKSRITSWITGQPILPVPIEKRSLTNIKKNTIPFVNHNPITIKKLLTKSGFEIQSKISVSNFRWPILKQLVPIKVLLQMESFFQTRLANIFFGPSIFILAKKANP